MNNKKVSKEEAIIVQSYVENPYLINGYKVHKFTLIYVQI